MVIPIASETFDVQLNSASPPTARSKAVFRLHRQARRRPPQAMSLEKSVENMQVGWIYVLLPVEGEDGREWNKLFAVRSERVLWYFVYGQGVYFIHEQMNGMFLA